MTMELKISDQVVIEARGYSAAPHPCALGQMDWAVVVLELGAGCAAMGAYRIHLTPAQARELADMLIQSADQAEPPIEPMDHIDIPAFLRRHDFDPVN